MIIIESFYHIIRVATWSGNQEKSGKTNNNNKSHVKIGVLKKVRKV